MTHSFKKMNKIASSNPKNPNWLKINKKIKRTQIASNKKIAILLYSKRTVVVVFAEAEVIINTRIMHSMIA